jgi:hypothetical protein
MKGLMRVYVSCPNRDNRKLQIFFISILLAIGILLSNADAQKKLSTSHGRNYIEMNVEPYTLPDSLLCKDGRSPTSLWARPSVTIFVREDTLSLLMIGGNLYSSPTAISGI